MSRAVGVMMADKVATLLVALSPTLVGEVFGSLIMDPRACSGVPCVIRVSGTWAGPEMVLLVLVR